jgi:hypothetical protein
VLKLVITGTTFNVVLTGMFLIDEFAFICGQRIFIVLLTVGQLEGFASL